MRRVHQGVGPDPLLMMLLASMGLVETGGCGGQSQGGDAGSSPMTMGGFGGMPLPGTEGVLGCVNPTPLGASDDGYLACEGHFIHREAAHACTEHPCVMDDHCPGQCVSYTGGVALSCFTPCSVDDDCGSGEICLCGATANYCVKAACVTDADCGDGLLCMTTPGVCGGYGDFYCQTPADECTASCPSGLDPATGATRPYHCERIEQRDGGQRGTCVQGTGGSCGRPFLVAGRPVTAASVAGGDWVDTTCQKPSLAELSSELRRTLAERWEKAALMEHASIAAFARFTLELMALGAPADLVRDAAGAMVDEQRHATTCFALASAYAGAPVGAGPLDVSRALAEVELESVAVTAFVEACIGETVAAIEARELARRAADPVIERVLAGIAADEARHAALGWRFVRWALQRGGSRLAERLEAELHRARERTNGVRALGGDDALLANGVVSPERAANLVRETLEHVVAPCLAALSGPATAVHRAPRHAGPAPYV